MKTMRLAAMALASCFLLSAAPMAAYADAGDRIERRLDRKGDRIDRRLDRKGHRIERRLDRRGH